METRPHQRLGGHRSLSPEEQSQEGRIASVPSVQGSPPVPGGHRRIVWGVALESEGECATPASVPHFLLFPSQESDLPTTSLPTVSLPDSLIAPPAAPALDPTDRPACERASRPGDPFMQPADFSPSAAPLSVPQPFLPVFSVPMLSPSPAPAPASPAVPLAPPPATALSPPTPPAFVQPQKFAGVSKAPVVITHTASATLTHDASATTFSQSQGLVITTHRPTPSASPCGLALSPVTRPPAVGPPQLRLTFVHPKPVSFTGGRPKQPPKIVPAPKPEPVSLVLKNACITPGESGREAGVWSLPQDSPLSPRLVVMTYIV